MRSEEAGSCEQQIRALLIEDNDADADLLQEALATETTPTIAVEWCDRLEKGLHRLLTENFDIVLLDLSLPDSISLDGLKRVRERAPELPIIICTGTADKELGLQAVKDGAQDYIVKGQPSGESIHRAIRYAIERKRSESIIRDTLEKLGLALQSSRTGVWTWWLQDNTLEWDDEVRRTFGGVEPSHEKFMAIIHPDDRRIVEQAIESAVRPDNAEYRAEYRIVWPDGSIHWVNAVGKTVFDADGRAKRVTGVCQETTVNREQQEVKRRLALMEQRQEFVAMLAHDLKTPITGTDRVLQLLLEGQLGPIPRPVNDVLSKILVTNQSLLHMINNVLDCYRLEEHAQSIECSMLSVDALFSSCVSQMQPLAVQSNLSLRYSIMDLEFIVADYVSMQRVLSNLVGNAIKFTPEGGKIELFAFERDGYAIVQVTDTGIGIDPAHTQKIFERFFQSDKRYRAKGLGMGLYLSKKLIEAQGGTIICKTDLGKGTTFEIQLPLFKPIGSGRVLVVDDDEVSRSVLKGLLQSLSLPVDVVKSGAAALAAIKETSYNAFFVDLMMPEMDGYTTTKALRKAGIAGPIIAYTAIADLDYLNLLGNGFSDVAQKPISIKSISQLVRKWLSPVINKSTVTTPQ